MFSHTIFFSCCLCLFITTTGGGILSGLVNTLTTIHHVLQPTVFLIYEVNLADLQAYVGPKLEVATFNHKAYIVIYLSNESVSYGTNFLPLGITLGPYAAVDIFTIVKYENAFNRETLFTALGNVLVTPICQLYTGQPYGCYLMNLGSNLALDNQTETYSFHSSVYGSRSSNQAKIDLAVTFDRTQKVNYNDLSSLAGFYLSPANNQNEAQSPYQRGQSDSTNTVLAVSTSQLNNLFYTDVYKCTIDSLQSNYVTAAIGNIIGLNENQPTLCLYTPYVTYDSTIALPTIFG